MLLGISLAAAEVSLAVHMAALLAAGPGEKQGTSPDQAVGLEADAGPEGYPSLKGSCCAERQVRPQSRAQAPPGLRVASAISLRLEGREGGLGHSPQEGAASPHAVPSI
jgi:hypothetical protein